MPTTDLKDLTDTIERIRKELHPDLDAAFLQAVAHAEQQNLEDDDEALRAIQSALKAALAARGAL